MLLLTELYRQLLSLPICLLPPDFSKSLFPSIIFTSYKVHLSLPLIQIVCLDIMNKQLDILLTLILFCVKCKAQTEIP